MSYEKWEPVKNYNKYYEVSDSGKVRSITRSVPVNSIQGSKIVQGRVLKAGLSSNGYVSVTLSKFGKFKYPSVHRLVAEAFIPNPKNLPQVNHKDGDKTNNNAWNLEWVDEIGNMKHASDLGLVDNRGVKSPNNKYSEEIIIEVKKLLTEGLSTVKISKLTGVNRTTVYRVKTGQQWSHI